MNYKKMFGLCDVSVVVSVAASVVVSRLFVIFCECEAAREAKR